MNATSATLLPAKGRLQLEQINASGDRIVIVASTIQPYIFCPCCGQPTNRIHSRYQRAVADLPWQGVAVQFQLNVRKFFCDNGECERRIFAEPLPAIVARYGRKTIRLTDALRELVFLVGGEVAARIAERFGFTVSAATLLRHLKKAVAAPAKTPRVLGIDDFAFKKGHRYGTVLVDLEKHRPVDLLPDRDAKTVEKWLKDNPGVQIVSRDRAEVYRNGVTAGAPSAMQIADRWHLIKNLGDALEKVIARKHRLLHEVMKPQDSVQNKEGQPQGKPSSSQEIPEPNNPRPISTNPSPRQERRQERYDEVVSLWRQGMNISTISRTTGCDRKTIRVWLSGSDLPPQSPRPERPGKIAPFEKHLSRRFEEGCRNGAQLLDEIKQMGFSGGYTTLNTYLSQMRKSGPKGDDKGASNRFPSSRRLSWAMTNRRSPKVTGEERALLGRLCESCPDMKTVSELGTAFCEMVRRRQGECLSSWLVPARACGVAEICSFALGLAGGLAAVTQPFSKGQAEGQVNRLKYLKRSMYGRAGFDLLRARDLHRATA